MTTEVQAQTEIKFLALGDSYTIGESVQKSERWPNQLATLIRQYDKKIADPTIIATTGWRTDNLTNAISIAKLKAEYDLVSLLIGVNNQYQGKSVEMFTVEFEKLVSIAVRLAKRNKENVFVISIPDYGFTPFGLPNKERITLAIDLFNDASRKVCDKMGVRYIYISDISREGLNDPTLVASDGLHPSGKMYALWAKRIAQQIIRK